MVLRREEKPQSDSIEGERPAKAVWACMGVG